MSKSDINQHNSERKKTSIREKIDQILGEYKGIKSDLTPGEIKKIWHDHIYEKHWGRYQGKS